MPILVKDYTWTQSDKMVNIKVPLKAVNHEKVDLFTTDSYIKAHFNPFLFEIFLLHDVDISKSKSIIKEDLIVIDLVKREELEWNDLERSLSKKEKMEIKQKIIEKCQEQAKQESEDRRIKKSQLDRFSVHQAMDIDNVQHNLMDSRRNAQRKKAMDDLEEWRQVVENEVVETGRVKIVELPDDDIKAIKNKTEEEIKVDFISNKSTQKADVVVDKANVKKEVKPRVKKEVKKLLKSEYVEKKKEESAKRVLPRLRETGQVEITHTPRTFPTPSRESQAREEEEWLKNVTQARRATGFVSEDLRPEEQDPQWCKDTGDRFFRNGNFLGAVSAYTHGITLSDKLPSLYSNRAATHFALGNFNKCVDDCSTALDLLRPACEGNRRSRAKCIARRGAALARIGFLNKGIDEMKAASKLLPDDEKIKEDIYDMERAWEQNPDSD